MWMSKPGRIGPLLALGFSFGARMSVTRSAVILSIESLLASHARQPGEVFAALLAQALKDEAGILQH